MKKLLMMFLSFQLSFLVLVTPVLGEDTEPSYDLNVSAPSALLMEASTGTVIYEKDADIPLKPASITKIMTLLLTLSLIHI